jgi:hypothetical protein
MSAELFELELLGGATERRYRKMRPEVEAMPWGTMDLSRASDDDRIAARRAWTGAAYQEHRTAVACAATLRALLEARAPIDLVATASRFPLDEMVHVELCARMAMECGGGTEIRYDPDAVILDAERDAPTLLRACELAVRFFCVGEAISIPLLRATWHAARHPLPRAVLGRIVRDEAAHGVYGWTFLDWALPLLPLEGKEVIRSTAAAAVREVHRLWQDIEQRPTMPEEAGRALGWLGPTEYLTLARRSMERKVLAPFARRGIVL